MLKYGLLSMTLVGALAQEGSSLISSAALRCLNFAVTMEEDKCGAGCVPTGNACPERQLAAQMCATASRPTACGEGCVEVETLETWVQGQMNDAPVTLPDDPETLLFRALRYSCDAQGSSAGCSRHSRALIAGVCLDGQNINSIGPACPRQIECAEQELCGCEACEACEAPAPTQKFLLQGVRLDSQTAPAKFVCLQAKGTLKARMEKCAPKEPKQVFIVEKKIGFKHWIINALSGWCLLHTGAMGPCTDTDVFILFAIRKFGGYQLRIPAVIGGADPAVAGKCLQAQYPNKNQPKLNNIVTAQACPTFKNAPLLQKKSVFNLNPIFL